MTKRDHSHWMGICLELAARGAGSVSPNPMVGCVIVAPEGTVLGKGWHQRFGGPHAEVHAIRAARESGHGDRLSESTLYVNLEPCTHHGKTPPCADLILEAGIRRVVVGVIDPHPQVSGKGIETLRAKGVNVDLNVMAREASRLNEPFIRHVATGRPLVVLKMAQSLDGSAATLEGDSRWISSVESRTLVHEWRSKVDAVMIGSRTAATDDPTLSIRHVEGRQPHRIVLDRDGTLPEDLRLFTDEHADVTVVVVADGVRPHYADAFESAGGRIVESVVEGKHFNLKRMFESLGRGAVGLSPMLSVLVEGGPGLGTALLRQDLVDRLEIFIAPKIVGGGIQSVGDLGISEIDGALTFAETRWEHVGDDMLFTGFRWSLDDLKAEHE